MFFDFSNHARARVPIFTPKMKNFRFARLARLARFSTRKWDFRRRARPRELAQRSQDDVSLNKLPQITLCWSLTVHKILEHRGGSVDPAKMEHELRLATHQQCAGGQDDGSLNKLPQTI